MVGRGDKLGTARCPACKTITHRLMLAGKQALCINTKCKVERFTVQAFNIKDNKAVYITDDQEIENKSYNNSPRGRGGRVKRERK